MLFKTLKHSRCQLPTHPHLNVNIKHDLKIFQKQIAVRKTLEVFNVHTLMLKNPSGVAVVVYLYKQHVVHTARLHIRTTFVRNFR